MKPKLHADSALIDKLGGTHEVARICEIKGPSVSEWRWRGIPKAQRKFLTLLRPDIFGAPSAPAAKSRAA